MSIAVLLTINLKGSIGGPVAHTDKQNVTVDVSPIGSSRPELMTRRIVHNDRKEMTCYRKLNIEESVANGWATSDCPRWEKPIKWRQMTAQQKIESYLNSFNEGYGVSYEFI